MRKLALVFAFLLLIITQNLFSQGSMSGNGLFLASAVQEGGKNVVLVHKFMTKELVRKFTQNLGTSTINEIKISNSGKYLYVKQGTKYTIFDVVSDRMITSISGVSQIVFANNADFFIALKTSSIIKYDCSTGSGSKTYSYPSGKKVISININQTDDFFAAQAVDKVYLYDISATSVKKQIVGSDFKFSADGKLITVLADLDTKIRVSSYELPTLYVKKTYTSDVFFRNIQPGGEVFPTRCSLSKYGKYVAVYTAFDVKVEIYIFDLSTGAKIWTINNFSNTENELFPQKWPADNVMIGYGTQLMAGEYNMINKQSKAIGLRIDDFTSSPALTLDNQQKKRIISPDYHYVIIQDGNNMIIRDSRIPNKKTTYTGVKFLSFSPDGKYLFVNKDGVVNAVVCQQISSGLQRNAPARLYAFDKVLSVAPPESMIANDATAPQGYAYFYVNNTKQIVKVDTAKLHYTFRSMKVDGNNVELQVNLVDANGNEFVGATDPNWRYIWCNLLLQNPNGSVGQINDYVVEEVNEDEPTAYALVLDHSGSMGAKRANTLQFGAWDMINHKKPNDAFLLVKYDNKVKLEVPLVQSKSSFQRKLANTGLAGFGGSTALIDAAYMAALKLAKANNYQKKAIILFTDGFENASIFSKADLLDLAVKNDIEINVVGFGDQVNEQYLKSIAYNTGGLYIHLYNTCQLRNVFRDVDFKRRHYYTVKFRTQTQGKQVAFLQLCQDMAQHDSIYIPFDNSVQHKPLDQRDLAPDLPPRSIHLTQFNQLKIPINPVLKPVTNRKVSNDFQNIEFPNILFKTSSDQIISSEQQGIDEIAEFMRKYPNVFLEIHGHTDNQGTPAFNMTLSKKRADAAKKLIIAKGVAPGRIITRGFGDTKPIAPNDTADGKAKNRRIEFHIFVQ